MTWNRSELGQRHIFYDETIGPHPDHPFPPHVETLRRSMLDFSCAHLDAHLGLIGLQESTGPIQRNDPALSSEHKALDKAKRLQNGGYSEQSWEDFFQAHFFKPLYDSVSVSEGDSRRVSRCNYYYNGFRLESNESWDVFSTRTGDIASRNDFKNVRCPKPDRAFYLQMYHLDTEPKIPQIHETGSRQWNQAPECSLVEPFAWSGLKELFEFGLFSTPFRVFDKEPLDARLKCYPWLLVEHKKGVSSKAEETVCCQAANGSACAVRLSQISARYANQLPFDSQIPPIPTITTMGSRVKVWITYFARDFDGPCTRTFLSEIVRKTRRKGYVMRAIWEGDMTIIEDVIKLQVILENTHTWAMRIFKPLMASYIGQWKHVHGNTSAEQAVGMKLRREQTLKRSLEILPMIQDVLNDHPTMELHNDFQPNITPALLGLLVHQICSAERQTLVGEIDRLITQGLTGPQTRTARRSRSRAANQERQDSQSAGHESNQSRLSSQWTGRQSDNTSDSDYEESENRSCDTDSLAEGHDDDEQENRRFTRSNSARPALTEAHTAPTGTTPPTEAASDSADTNRNDFTPQSRSAPRLSTEEITLNRPVLSSSHSENTIRTSETFTQGSDRAFQTPCVASEAESTTDPFIFHGDNSSPTTTGANWEPALDTLDIANIDWGFRAMGLSGNK